MLWTFNILQNDLLHALIHRCKQLCHLLMPVCKSPTGVLSEKRNTFFCKFSIFLKWWTFELHFIWRNKKKHGRNRSELYSKWDKLLCCVLKVTVSLSKMCWNQSGTNLIHLTFIPDDLMHNRSCKSQRFCSPSETHSTIRVQKFFQSFPQV